MTHRRQSLAGVIGIKGAQHADQVVETMLERLSYDDRKVTARLRDGSHNLAVGCVSARDATVPNVCAVGSGRFEMLWSGDLLAGEKLVGARGGSADVAAAAFLRLYAERPNVNPSYLEGIFSGILVDRERNEVRLFNDTFGLGRIYFHSDGESFYFSTEAKALLAVIPNARFFDETALEAYLKFGVPPDNRCLFRSVEVLPPASWWVIRKDGTSKDVRYRAVGNQPPLDQGGAEDPQSLDRKEHFAETLKTALPRYLISKNPVGLSLTGGLDTRAIVASWPKEAPSPITYTFDGLNGSTFDTTIAAHVAALQGWRHSVLRIAPTFLNEFGVWVDKTVFSTDGCLGMLGTHEIYLNRLASEIADVRLTGNFGSELFRGASALAPLAIDQRLFSPEWGHRINTRMPVRKPSTAADAAAEIPQFHFGTVAASSSRVCFRSPYLDSSLLPFVGGADSAKINTRRFWDTVGQGRSVLRDLLTDRGDHGRQRTVTTEIRRLHRLATFKADYIYNEGGPLGLSKLSNAAGPVLTACRVTKRHKYLNYRHWLGHELREYVKTVLASSEVRHSPLWNQAFVADLVRSHSSGWQNRAAEINLVVTLATIDRLLLRRN